MIKGPIWKDTYYESTASTLEYYLQTGDGGKDLYNGYTTQMPDATGVSINVSSRLAEQMNGDIPDFRDVTGSVISNAEAYQEFRLVTGNTIVEEYAFLNDWSYEDKWSGQTKYSMSQPINGHLDPRMKVMATIFNTGQTSIDETITFKSWVKTNPTSFNVEYDTNVVMLEISASNLTHWTASTAYDWIGIDVTAGTGYTLNEIDLDTNTGVTARAGTIIITYDGGTVTVPVSQGYAWANVFPSSITYLGVGGTENASISSNCPWTLSTPSWITASTASGNSGITTISLTAGRSSLSSARTDNVVITYVGRATNIAVTQEAGEVPESYKLYYTSTDGNTVTPYSAGTGIFGANIVSNTYDATTGGCITFDGPVTSIGQSAFNRCYTLDTITIPTDVSGKIGNTAFQWCTGLTEVHQMNWNINEIGSGAFAYCTSLVNITLLESLQTIQQSAFAYCTSLTEFRIPTNVTSIGVSAFIGCTSLPTSGGIRYTALFDNSNAVAIEVVDTTLSAYTIMPYTKFLGSDLFVANNLQYVTIPSSVEYMSRHAFYNCPYIEEIQLPSALKAVDSECIVNNSFLYNIQIPSSVESIGQEAFKNNIALVEIVAKGNTPATLGAGAFDNTNNCPIYVPVGTLSTYQSAWSEYSSRIQERSTESTKIYYTSTDGNVVTPHTAGTEIFGAEIVSNTYSPISGGCIQFDGDVTGIGQAAFQGCNTLTTITLPEDIWGVDELAFAECYNLVEFSGDYTGITSDRRGIVVDDYFCAFAESGLTTYALPQNITGLGHKAFYKTHLTSITLSNYDEYIPAESFYGSRLVEINLPNAVQSIGDGCFADCTALTSVTIGTNLIDIQGYAFSGCTNLTSITVNATGQTFIQSDIFDGIASAGTFYYRYGGDFSAWIEALPRGWTAEPIIPEKTICYTSTDDDIVTPYYTTRFGANIVSNTYTSGCGYITFDGDVTQIGDSSFYTRRTLRTIIIPDTVTSIGETAFDGCSSLVDIEIPDGITIIKTGTFDGCTSLANVIIPSSVTTIEWMAFNLCQSLLSIEIPSGITSLGTNPFTSCSSLTEFNGSYSGISSDNRCLSINGSIVSFAPGGLTSYSIPSNYTNIGDSAFAICRQLVSITIPSGITSVSYGAFNSCSALSAITVNAITAPTLGTCVFPAVSSTGTLYYPSGSDYSTWIAALPSGWTATPI